MAKRRIAGSTADYAKAHGVSARTARRHVSRLPGASKSGGKWSVPLTTKEYAQARGVSERTARREAQKQWAALLPRQQRVRDVAARLAGLSWKGNYGATSARVARYSGYAFGREERASDDRIREMAKMAPAEFGEEWWDDEPDIAENPFWYH
jgi:hypothetical protein